MSAIRTCIVSEKNGEARLKPEDECSFSDEVLTHFIEQGAVLDLLERAYPLIIASPLLDEVSAFLRAHGRLGGET